eukprot:11848790-Alexandrium_andersonii.AAC.1
MHLRVGRCRIGWPTTLRPRGDDARHVEAGASSSRRGFEEARRPRRAVGSRNRLGPPVNFNEP